MIQYLGDSCMEAYVSCVIAVTPKNASMSAGTRNGRGPVCRASSSFLRSTSISRRSSSSLASACNLASRSTESSCCSSRIRLRCRSRCVELCSSWVRRVSKSISWVLNLGLRTSGEVGTLKDIRTDASTHAELLYLLQCVLMLYLSRRPLLA